MSQKVKFIRKGLSSFFLDPRKDFAPTQEVFEVRTDPLTGRTSHFSHFGAIKPQSLDLEIYNTAEVKGFCPFCEDVKATATPKFHNKLIPGGRLSKGEALLVPNLHPYDVYSAVMIMTNDHVVPLSEFSYERLSDSFSGGIEFLKKIASTDPSLPYHIMAWNYMPPSGGGLVHPHQQYFATEHPGNQFTDEFKAAEVFYRTYQADYWSELVTEEQRLDQRCIGQVGSTQWLTSFVSLGVLGEVMCVFPEVFCINDFTDAHIHDLVVGTQKLFAYYVDSDIFSFNASLFFGPKGQAFFPAHMRIVPRTFLNTRDYASDFNFFQSILQEPISVVMPEDLCRDLKNYFKELS